MKLSRILPLAALALVLTPSAAPAEDDPAVIVARRCVGRVEQAVERNRNIAAEKTRECLQDIRRLLAAGNEDRAIAVGRRCIAAAEDRAEASADVVNELCDECLAILRELEADGLGPRVQNVCDEAILELRSILQRQRSAIEGALSGT